MAMPKVFSLFKTKTYEELFPNISILGKKVDFFLECSSYDMLLPVKVKAESRLDVFEEAVLKLLAFQALTAGEIADLLCLTEDLINFILIRLQEMDFLQDNGRELTEQGKQYIHVSTKNQEEENIEYAQAKIFVLKQTGEILPYVQTGEFLTEHVEDFQGSMLTAEFGTAGNPVWIKGQVLRQKWEDKKKGMLQSAEIRKALNRYNRIVEENAKYSAIVYAREWAIENTVSDDIFFHMQAVIQKGNIDEVLVSDGLVLNVDFVNRYIKKNYPDFLLKIKEKETKNMVPGETKKEVSDHPAEKSLKYRELKKLMSKITAYPQLYTVRPEEEETAFSQDENKMLQGEQKKFLLNCYSAFEWSLFYYDWENPMNSQMRGIVENQSASQNEKTILQMAQKMGVHYPEAYKELFFMLDKKRMNRMYKDSVPELRTALSIAILTSADDESCGFRKLFQSQPGMFAALRRLFREHGDLSHQTLTYDINTVRNKEIYELLTGFLKNLQPDYSFNGEYAAGDTRDLISQERLNAEVSLSKKLGTIYFYNLLPKTIKEEWILVSPDKTRYPEAAEYFHILYRIMQDTLLYSLKDIRKNPELEKKELLLELKEKGIHSKCFDTVQETFVKQALMNEKSTLGAVAMVYLYYQEDDKRKRLEEQGFAALIEQLVLFRKHGNNVALSVDTEILNKLRDDMLTIVKMIGGF